MTFLPPCTSLYTAEAGGWQGGSGGMLGRGTSEYVHALEGTAVERLIMGSRVDESASKAKVGQADTHIARPMVMMVKGLEVVITV